MVRIALDCRSVFPGMGGIGRYAAMLAAALPRLDASNEYHLLVTGRKSEEALCEAPNVVERRSDCGMIDERWEQLELPGELSGCGAALYHSTCFALPVACGATRCVTTVHDVVFRRHPQLVAPRLRDYLDRWTEVSLDVADLVITVSDYSKTEICALYDVSPEKIRVIHNGVDRRFFVRPSIGEMTATIRKLNWPGRYVLYVGALEEKKNISGLLRAWRSVVESGRGGGRTLILAGGGGGKSFDAIEAVRAAGVEDSVRLAGYVSEEDIVAVMCGADLFVYPSLYEGFGLPVLEAMACEVPVVTSTTSSLGEVAGDAALAVDPEDEAALARAIVTGLCDEPLIWEMKRRGRAHASGFTQERCAAQTLAVYREVLA